MFESKSAVPAERFSGLLAAKGKALSVFHKAHKSLHDSIAKIHDEVVVCTTRHEEHLANAKREKEFVEFLKLEADKAKVTADKLGEILGV